MFVVSRKICTEPCEIYKGNGFFVRVTACVATGEIVQGVALGRPNRHKLSKSYDGRFLGSVGRSDAMRASRMSCSALSSASLLLTSWTGLGLLGLSGSCCG